MRILLLTLLVSLTLVGCRTAEPPPDPTFATVTVTLQEGHEAFVRFVAYQDGLGAWSELTAADGAYRFEVTDAAGRYGVAVVCYYTDDGDAPYVEPVVIHATAEELSALTLPCVEALYDSPDQVEGTLIAGEIINVDPVEFGTLFAKAGGIGHSTSAVSDYGFNLGYLYDGVFDVMAVVEDDDYKVTRLVIEHDVEVSGGASPYVTIDWDESAEVETFGLTVHGVAAGDELYFQSGLETKNGTWAGFTSDFVMPATSGHATAYNAAPRAMLADGDLHSLYVSSEDASGQSRTVIRYFVEGDDFEVTLPAGDLDLVATPVTTGAYARYEVTWSDVGATLVNAYYSYETDELEVGWDVLITPGWLVERAYTVPDLSGLDGWDPAWNVSQADIVDAYNWFGAYFEPVAEALRSWLTWPATQEGQISYLSANF